MKVDFTGEVYKDKEVLPEGDYNVIVKNVEILDSKSTQGSKYFFWTLETENGHKLEARTTCIKGKRWLLKQALTCCGVKVDGEVFDFQISELKGKTFIVKVGIKKEDWTGNDGNVRTSEKNEVKQFLLKTNETNQSAESSSQEQDVDIPF